MRDTVAVIQINARSGYAFCAMREDIPGRCPRWRDEPSIEQPDTNLEAQAYRSRFVDTHKPSATGRQS